MSAMFDDVGELYDLEQLDTEPEDWEDVEESTCDDLVSDFLHIEGN